MHELRLQQKHANVVMHSSKQDAQSEFVKLSKKSMNDVEHHEYDEKNQIIMIRNSLKKRKTKRKQKYKEYFFFKKSNILANFIKTNNSIFQLSKIISRLSGRHQVQNGKH